MSDTAQFLESLQQLDTLKAAALILVGGVSLLMGWKLFKVLITANALFVGVFVGMTLGAKLGATLGRENMDIIVGIAFGLLFAALAWPMMKWSVSVMGGLAGAFLGYFLWRYGALAAGQPNLQHLGWVGGLIGLITMGLLALIIFKGVVIVFTAFEGALFLVSGLVALLLKSEALRGSLKPHLAGNEFLLPLLVLVPTVMGVIFQQAKSGGHKPPAGGGGGGGPKK